MPYAMSKTIEYNIKNINTLDTPALVIYQSGVKRNIEKLVASIDDVTRLRPHIKTHKTKEVTKLLQQAGIQKFKCATIAETELLASCQAQDVLLAYQPVAKKLLRFIEIIKTFPDTKLSCLVDALPVAEEMSKIASENDITLSVYIDLNVGMNRTGISPENAFDLILSLQKTPSLKIEGLHIYDGHIHDADIEIRKQKCNEYYPKVELLVAKLENEGIQNLNIVAGGTPTYPIHSQRETIECSPGTFVYWDKGYQNLFQEQDFEPSALVISRVISLPDKDKICLDLGHKSIAAENPLERRVFFLNAPNATFIGQSEEHLILGVSENHSYKIGDIFYGLPIHICPTCALYERAYIVEHENLTGEEWKIIARDRKISI
ncbi:D-serine deaminase-like pyridoxal phosphate-dependent protein [Arcicella aurantiaca]|uniref:D-serine deaminase-like pyridoxal phosphate-dependent protein n=2 Tax=Arcicella aurantiaca TaxID=591202 RepID=A0A316EBU5_9BACT|nr:D-serine deaminase-like pyridoxal phosphate-dependent protein [Arcicella aurantiaca]